MTLEIRGTGLTDSMNGGEFGESSVAKPSTSTRSENCTTLYSMIKHQIVEPDRTSAYVGRVIEYTKHFLDEPHDLTPEEGKVFGLLYRAIFDTLEHKNNDAMRRKLT